MKLSNYFAEKNGTGVLSTANKAGEVNSAIYAKPHVNETAEISFIMGSKRTKANLLENPSASYLFIEKDNGFKGIRLSLTMIGESDDQNLIATLTKRHSDTNTERSLVIFRINKAIELVGDKVIELG